VLYIGQNELQALWSAAVPDLFVMRFSGIFLWEYMKHHFRCGMSRNDNMIGIYGLGPWEGNAAKEIVFLTHSSRGT
jgi:hypothetical protein